MEKERKFWTCQGNVTGWCGHMHRTAKAALLCCRRHQRQTGGSDRRPVAVADRKDAARLWELHLLDHESWQVELVLRYEALPYLD